MIRISLSRLRNRLNIDLCELLRIADGFCFSISVGRSYNNPLASLLRRIRLTLEMIKFEHSIFALPFALTGALLAWRDAGFTRDGLWAKLAWIVVSMVAARSVAMAFNRVLDAEIDARNPRTKSRHLPAGLLSRRFAWGFIALWGLVFFFPPRGGCAAWLLHAR